MTGTKKLPLHTKTPPGGPSGRRGEEILAHFAAPAA